MIQIAISSPIEVRILGGKCRVAEMRFPVFAVLVSELMLQQTQVATVIRYYETWMNVTISEIHFPFQIVLSLFKMQSNGRTSIH